MAHRARRNKNVMNSNECREPPAWLEGCTNILGLWHKKVLEREANRAKLVAAGFLLPRAPSRQPEPWEQIPFAEWEKRRKGN